MDEIQSLVVDDNTTDRLARMQDPLAYRGAGILALAGEGEALNKPVACVFFTEEGEVLCLSVRA